MAGAWTFERKKRLAEDVHMLKSEDLSGLVAIVVNAMAVTNPREEIEIDMDLLPDHVLRQMEKYVLDRARQVSPPLSTRAACLHHRADSPEQRRDRHQMCSPPTETRKREMRTAMMQSYKMDRGWCIRSRPMAHDRHLLHLYMRAKVVS